jgi:hypothetical protein
MNIFGHGLFSTPGKRVYGDLCPFDYQNLGNHSWSMMYVQEGVIHLLASASIAELECSGMLDDLREAASNVAVEPRMNGGKERRRVLHCGIFAAATDMGGGGSLRMAPQVSDSSAGSA